jgi:carbon monoxide dehydrogenase subunit G
VIEYRRRFRLGAPPQVVWAALEEFCCLESSTPWVRDLEVNGPGLCDGSVLSATIATPLACRMKVVFELERCVLSGSIVGTVSGDLRGQAGLVLEGDGNGTRVEVAWTFEMMQRSMRAVARVAGPALRWGHDLVVEGTIEALRARVHELQRPGRSVRRQDG